MECSPEAPWFGAVDRHSSVVVFIAYDFDATVHRTKVFPDVRSTYKNPNFGALSRP